MQRITAGWVQAVFSESCAPPKQWQDFAAIGLQLTANLLVRPEYRAAAVMDMVCAPKPANQHAQQLCAWR